MVSVCGYAVGVAVTTSAASAYITDLTHRSTYGAAHGVFGTIYDVGDAAGPLLGGVLVALLGYARTFQIMAATVLVAAILFSVLDALERPESRQMSQVFRPVSAAQEVISKPREAGPADNETSEASTVTAGACSAV